MSQSRVVDHYGANERLDVIRTLMERSAIYRRALAPVMLMLGALGIGAGAAGYFFTTQTYIPLSHSSFFALYWMFISFLALAVAYAQVRKQAVRDGEPFWSPPTRRVTQALAPALAVGAVLGLSVVLTPEIHWFLPPPPVQDHAWGLPPLWMLLYGVAVHSAGFFMPRGFKIFGWAFIVTGAFVFLFISKLTGNVSLAWAHVLMGEIFGGAHLAYGVYLAITEKRYAVA